MRHPGWVIQRSDGITEKIGEVVRVQLNEVGQVVTCDPHEPRGIPDVRRDVMATQNRIEETRRLATILRQRGAPLADVVGNVPDVRKLPRQVREQIVDELGEEFSSRASSIESEVQTITSVRLNYLCSRVSLQL